MSFSVVVIVQQILPKGCFEFILEVINGSLGKVVVGVDSGWVGLGG